MSRGGTGAAARDAGAAVLPGWVRDVVAGAPSAARELAVLSRAGGPGGRREGRPAAVLVCLSPGTTGAVGTPGDRDGASGRGGGPPVGDVLVLERAAGLRAHAGQPALPGGAVDPGDDGAVGAALREAQEETGLAVEGVHVLATMPVLRVPPEGFAVTPVLAWEPEPSPVAPGDPGEVVRVLRVPLAQLLDPRRRVRVVWERRLPGVDGGPGVRQRGEGPGFEVDAGSEVGADAGAAGPAADPAGRLLVWGFTAAVLSALLDAAGLAPGWDGARVVPAPAPPRAPAAAPAASPTAVPPTAVPPTAAGEVAP